jgi:hypothetical protein
VEFVWELHLERLGVDLDDRTLTPLEKIAQVVSKLGALSRSRTPKGPPRMSRRRSGLLSLSPGTTPCHCAHECLTAVRVAVLALLTATPAGFTLSRDEVDRLAALRQPSSRQRRPPVQTLFDKWALASDPALSDHQGEGERS